MRTTGHRLRAASANYGLPLTKHTPRQGPTQLAGSGLLVYYVPIACVHQRRARRRDDASVHEERCEGYARGCSDSVCQPTVIQAPAATTHAATAHAPTTAPTTAP